MSGITIYTVKIHGQAAPGKKLQIVASDGWVETPKTYKNGTQRELKVDMDKVTYRGFITTDPNRLDEGAKLILEANKKRAEEQLETAQTRMDEVVDSAVEVAQAFNLETITAHD